MWGIAQTLLNQLTESWMEKANCPLQYFNVSSTTLQFTSPSYDITIVRITISARKGLTWEFLDEVNTKIIDHRPKFLFKPVSL